MSNNRIWLVKHNTKAIDTGLHLVMHLTIGLYRTPNPNPFIPIDTYKDNDLWTI